MKNVKSVVSIPVRALNVAIRNEVSAEVNASARWMAVAFEVASKLDADNLKAGLIDFREKAKESRSKAIAEAGLPADAEKRLDARIRKAISRAGKAIKVIVDNDGEIPADANGEPLDNLNAFEQHMIKAGKADDKSAGKSFNDQLLEVANKINRAKSDKRKAALADEIANMIVKRYAS